jgi:hypothetical protein
MKHLTIKFLILICVLFATTTIGAQTNLLLNGKADSKTEYWNADREEAIVEEFNRDNVFVLRNGTSLQQYVQLTDEAIGKYALFIGFVTGERANVDDKRNTNLRYLYIYITATSAIAYTQIMRDNAKSENEWHTIYAIHQVTKEDIKDSIMKCFLYHDEKQNVQNDGSAVRFDNLGLYLFETEEDALNFAKTYK